MAGRPRTRSDEEVFAATMRAIGRHGPARLTLADVAREAGLAASTLAERFGSKRALLLAAAQHVAGDAGADAAAQRRRAGSPLAAVTGFLVAGTRGARTRAALANHLAFLALDVADREFRAAAAGHALARRAALAELLAAAVQEGELRPDADPAALARAVEVAYNGALISWALTGAGPLADAIRADVGFVLEPWAIPRRAAPA
jgi:AcrR family transcriptional regulator